MTFTSFDIVVFIIIAISSSLGVYRGIINIMIDLLGFVASIICAIFLYSYIKILFLNYIESDLALSIVSGVCAYIISLISFTFLTSKIVYLFKDTSKSALDRILGLIIGILRGVVFSMIIFTFTAIITTGVYLKSKNVDDLVKNLSFKDYPKWLQDSVSTPYLDKTLKLSMLFIPEEILRSVQIPQNRNNKDDDIINTIKRKKNLDTNLQTEQQLNQDLEDKIDSILDN